MITKRMFQEHTIQAQLSTEIELTVVSIDGEKIETLTPKTILYDQDKDRIVMIAIEPYKGKNHVRNNMV